MDIRFSLQLPSCNLLRTLYHDVQFFIYRLPQVYICSSQFPEENKVSMSGNASFGDCLPPRSILLFLFFPARRRAAAEIYAMYASARTSRPGACSGLGCGRWGGGGRRRGETCAKLTHARALCCDFLNAFQAISRYLSF